jgi:hypothetical protein
MTVRKDYSEIIVESFIPDSTSGLHGIIHIRPLEGQDPFLSDMHVECAKELSNEFPLGTQFRIQAKITSRNGGEAFIYSHYKWTYVVIDVHSAHNN